MILVDGQLRLISPGCATILVYEIFEIVKLCHKHIALDVFPQVGVFP